MHRHMYIFKYLYVFMCVGKPHGGTLYKSSYCRHDPQNQRPNARNDALSLALSLSISLSLSICIFIMHTFIPLSIYMHVYHIS